MLCEKGRHLLGLVGGEVVEDDVNFLVGLTAAHHLPEKLDEVLAGVARRGLPMHLAGLGVQGCVEG